MSEATDEQIEALKQSIAALEAQGNTLGDTVVEAALVPLREKLAELEARQQAEQRVGQQVVEQQRKQVTVLFMDIGDSTQLVSGMDPEEAMEVFDSALKRLGRVVEAQGGRVTRYSGDGLMAVFGAPVAREDDPQRAVRAGLGLVEEARQVGEALGIAQFYVDQHQVSGARWLQARTRIYLGDALRGRDSPGDRERARQTYQEALDIFKEMGADGYVQVLLKRLESLPAEHT